MTGTWTRIPAAPLTSRRFPELLWTGRELLVLGGQEIRPPEATDPAGCRIDDTVRFDDGAAFDPVSKIWRPLAGRVSFHHGAVWTGSRLTDGFSWSDPHTGESGAAPENALLVYAPALWTGNEVINVGSDGSGQPCAHTVWAWNPATGRTRTSPVPGPPCGESVGVRWTGSELLVTTWMTYRGTHAWNPATGLWRTIPEDPGPVADGGWNGEHLVAVATDVPPSVTRPFVRHPDRFRLTSPVDGTWRSLALPDGLQDPLLATFAVAGIGRTAVVNGPRVAILGADDEWSGIEQVSDGDSFTWTWADRHLVAWADSGEDVGWTLAMP